MSNSENTPKASSSSEYDEEKIVEFTYPKLPLGLDFETFRKTDEQWKKYIDWFNQPRKGEEPNDALHTKERFVLLQWPRDPKGPPMKVTPDGKHTGNGCKIWGATLYDFYRIYRIPDCPNLSCISSGSKLAAWMKEIGELDFAKDQLKQAELEEEPHVMYPYAVGEFLKVVEEQVWKGRVGKPLAIDRTITNMTSQFLFPPSTYPAPWPLRPFSAPTMRLQRYFPIGYLPKKLIVHDPWHTLEVTSPEARKYQGTPPKTDPRTCKWGSDTPDIIRTYHLKLNEDGERQLKAVRIISEHAPKDYVVCAEAHLYITPRRRIGSGHHSFVYQVELELPRDLLVPAEPCMQCALEKIMAQKNDILNKSGKEPAKNPLRNGTSSDTEQRHLYSVMFKNRQPFEEKDRDDPRFQSLRFLEFNPECRHRSNGIRYPPSQKVSVTAKLTIPDDGYEAHSQHLENEAKVYQEFPIHMYQHWNGYNVIAPIREPVPVGAVAPQFYGFYVPDADNEPIKDGKFMSPILLLEHCGVSVNPEKLTMDQRQECFSLLKRLHISGYVHQSVYGRNILMQYGPLHFSPFQRSSEHLRFRLIDFGRTKKYSDWRETVSEYNDANQQLRLEMY